MLKFIRDFGEMLSTRSPSLSSTSCYTFDHWMAEQDMKARWMAAEYFAAYEEAYQRWKAQIPDYLGAYNEASNG